MDAVNTGIRITRGQYERLDTLAKALGVTRNAVVGQLIDNAQIAHVQRQEAVPSLFTNNNRGAQGSQATGAAVVN